ncbi:MAG: Hg(II)-responsive transcriptional regulator [Betaproteobacteria bacterium]|nr:Hg(II)-responsive transcriptional regulator [Betaproteobacteria bacterium]
MPNKPENLTIGTVAGMAEVNVETIRFYQRKGLLPEPQRPYGSIRRYGAADVARVKFVKSAQRLGFSLEEVAGLLSLEDGTHCDEARTLAEHKLKNVREKLADLRRIESVLARLIKDCCVSQGTITCPLIAALQAP